MPSSREAAIKAPSDLMSLKCWVSGLNGPVRIRILSSVRFRLQSQPCRCLLLLSTGVLQVQGKRAERPNQVRDEVPKGGMEVGGGDEPSFIPSFGVFNYSSDEARGCKHCSPGPGPRSQASVRRPIYL